MLGACPKRVSTESGDRAVGDVLCNIPFNGGGATTFGASSIGPMLDKEATTVLEVFIFAVGKRRANIKRSGRGK